MRSGFRGGVNYYRNLDANHRATSRLPASTSVAQPCLFLAGEFDVTVLWAGGAEGTVADVERRCEQLAGAYLVRNCAHWLMQEGAPAARGVSCRPPHREVLDNS